MTGFSARGLEAAHALLTDRVTARVWPGAVAAVGHGDQLQAEWVAGWAEDGPGGRRPMTRDTVFDLASLTKVLATLPAVLQAVGRGEVGLDTPLAAYVAGVDPRPTVRHALTHTTGLPSHQRFTVSGPAELVAAAAAVPLVDPPGTRVLYSDLGFVLLGGVVAAVTGRAFEAVVADDVMAPSGSSARFLPPAAWRERTAATEVVDGVTTLGVVHDENAAAGGGVAGHAGLFGTVDDVRTAVPIWLADGPLLEATLRAEALADQTPALDGHRGLGWTARGDAFDVLDDGWVRPRCRTPGSPAPASPSTPSPAAGPSCSPTPSTTGADGRTPATPAGPSTPLSPGDPPSVPGGQCEPCAPRGVECCRRRRGGRRPGDRTGRHRSRPTDADPATHVVAGRPVAGRRHHRPRRALRRDRLGALRAQPGHPARAGVERQALHVLGGHGRALGLHSGFYTTAATAGTRVGHVLQGDLYLKGYGDPTITAGGYDTLAASVAASGVTRVDGALVADDTWFDSARYGPFWSIDDTPFYYSAQTSALTLAPDTIADAGTVLVDVTPARTVGAPAVVTVTPANSYVQVVDQATTGAAGSPSTVTAGRSADSAIITVTGSIPVGAATYAAQPTVVEPTGLAASVFRAALARHGVSVHPADPVRGLTHHGGRGRGEGLVAVVEGAGAVPEAARTTWWPRR